MEERVVKISADPEPISVELAKSAVIVIDMQNAFIIRGGMFDIVGFEVSKFRRIIKPLKYVLDISRIFGLKIIYVRHVYSPDLSDTGTQESPNYWKEYSIVLMRKNLGFRDKLLIRGTWGAEIIDEIKPLAGDFVIDKQRYSGFANTELENMLKSLNAKYLFFTGIALNVCVESTIRDAFSKEFWPILISDCCAATGPKCTREAALWNVKQLFGWVTTSRNYIKALQRKG
ncbi:MAG: cysteine hydrolase [Nitrososphaerota archaeon]